MKLNQCEKQQEPCTPNKKAQSMSANLPLELRFFPVTLHRIPHLHPTAPSKLRAQFRMAAGAAANKDLLANVPAQT